MAGTTKDEMYQAAVLCKTLLGGLWQVPHFLLKALCSVCVCVCVCVCVAETFSLKYHKCPSLAHRGNQTLFEDRSEQQYQTYQLWYAAFGHHKPLIRSISQDTDTTAKHQIKEQNTCLTTTLLLT